jgi:prolyl-tRNA editing enzyme YbaK/EbsC (Cys-tRNA(Pro) deacylase)
MSESGVGQILQWRPAVSAPELLAKPVSTALNGWAATEQTEVAPIDPALADTAEFCRTYGVSLAESANCVIVAGKREGEVRYGACLVLATTRADVNGVVRRLLDVRKASFAAMDEAVVLTGMEYGGITPIGLPPEWRVLVDSAVIDAGAVVIGSGIRGSKLRLPGRALLDLPSAEPVSGLAKPVWAPSNSTFR